MKFRIQIVVMFVILVSILFLAGCTLETMDTPKGGSQVGRDIVLTEVYIIPPDRFYSYAWVEIFNPTNTGVILNARLHNDDSGVDTVIQTALLMNVERRYVSSFNIDFIVRVDSGTIWLPVTTGSSDSILSPGKFLVITNNENKFYSHFRLGPFDPLLVNLPFSFLRYDTSLQFAFVDSLHQWYPLTRGEITLKRYYISTAGYIASSDGSVPWNISLSGGWPKTPVAALVVKGSAVFAGTLTSGVLRSQDNGQTWSVSNTGLTDPVVFSMYTDGTSLYGGTKGKLFVSTNDGDSWSNIGNGLPDDAIVRAIASREGHLYVGTNRGVYHSTNNGTSWTQGDSGLTNSDVRSLAVIGNTIFAATFGDGIFRSTNDGQSWSFSGIRDTKVYSLLVDSSRFFAGTSNGVHRSLDSGRTWSATASFPSGNPTVLSLVRKEQRLYIGTPTRGIWYTTNNGGSWLRSDSGVVPFSFLEVRSLAAAGSRILAGTKSNFQQLLGGSAVLLGVYKVTEQTLDVVRYGNYGVNSLADVPEFSSIARYVGFYETGNPADAFYISDKPIPGWYSQRRK
jgi:photosystem II stability/assembly factor-like uncharacterized protein